MIRGSGWRGRARPLELITNVQGGTFKRLLPYPKSQEKKKITWSSLIQIREDNLAGPQREAYVSSEEGRPRPFCPDALHPRSLRLGSSKEEGSLATQPHLPVPSSSSGPCTTLHHPICSRRQGGQRVALGDPCTLLPEFLPQRRRDHKARLPPASKAGSHLVNAVCSVVPSLLYPARSRSCSSQGWGPGGEDPWRSLSAHIPSLAPHGSSPGGWHVHRRPGSSGSPAYLEPARGRTPSSRQGCEHPACYPEAHVGSIGESELRLWVRGLLGCPPGAPAPGEGIRLFPAPGPLGAGSGRGAGVPAIRPLVVLRLLCL